MKIEIHSAEEISDKIQMVLNKEISVANEKGFILSGERKGDLSLTAYKTVKEDKGILDQEKNVFWQSISYNDSPIGSLGIKNKNLQPETLNLMSGMAEVILYQNFLLKNLYSITDIRAQFLIDLLASNKYKTFEEIYSEADILKINLREKLSVIIIKINDLVEDYLKTLEKLSSDSKKVKVINYIQEVELFLKQCFKDYDQNTVAYVNNNQFIILKGITGEKITTENSVRFFKEKAKYLFESLSKKYPNKTITMGVGQFYPELEGLKKSYQDAKIALDIGLKVWGGNKAYHILDIGTFASLSGEISQKRKMEIAEQVLSKLLETPELLKTIKIFLSSGMNLTMASKELHIHRNTLIYRLNKAKKTIGLDPKKFSDALQIKLGLLICQVK
ncbi:MAG: helix-turn-helix domain-containing protein [Patescibacteria group bacterium]|nr:helix-turn-helix domain-containing protein [Patescibacteria group bacterium]